MLKVLVLMLAAALLGALGHPIQAVSQPVFEAVGGTGIIHQPDHLHPVRQFLYSIEMNQIQ